MVNIGEENAVNEPEEIIGELPKLKTKDNEAGQSVLCLVYAFT